MVHALISKFSGPGLGSKGTFFNKMSSRLFAALLPSIPRDAEPFKAPSQAGALIGHMIENIDGGTVGLLIHKCLALFEKHPAAIAEVSSREVIASRDLLCFLLLDF